MIKIKRFDELTTRELYEILRQRAEVFMLGLGMRCRDLDREDFNALHCFIESETGEICAYMRVLERGDGNIMIGRVLAVPRGTGLGKRLITESLPELKERLKADTVTVHAQLQAEGFYRALGFIPEGEPFCEAGVMHVFMQRGID